MRFLKSNLQKVSVLSYLGITAMLITACSGSGDAGGNVTPIVPVVTTDCITNPVAESKLPTGNVIGGDQVFHNYTSPDTVWQGSTWPVYGYTNPNTIHVKTINIFNNHFNVIYPVVYSPTSFAGSDGQQKKLSRIFVGKPSCADKSAFYAGIPPGGSATVYVPKQMWDAGHVKLFTEVPKFLQEDVNAPITAPLFTIDTAPNSPNKGYFLYTSGTKNDFPTALPFQLTEYTFGSLCHDDNKNCAVASNDMLTVDYDISSVDQLFLPVAMQESSGSRGYVGTGITVDAFQSQLKSFVLGKNDFAYSKNVGWPYYYGSNQANGYLNNLIKVPTGANVVTSILNPSPSPYNPDINNPTVNSVWVYDLLGSIPAPTDNQATLQKVLTDTDKNGLQDRWVRFWHGDPNVICKDQPQQFCTNFYNTMAFIYQNVENACQYTLTQFGEDPALCLKSNVKNPQSVATDVDKIQKIIGYNFRGTTFSDAGPYPAKDPLNMCTVEAGPVPAKNGEFYSNCFRDMVKSVLRGVPYPFWQNTAQYYPALSSIYTLNPIVWLIHKQMDLAVYAFSVDDDLGNQLLIGKGFNIAVAGLTGMPTANVYGGTVSNQILSFPGDAKNPFWKAAVTGTTESGSTVTFPACIPGQAGAPPIGACDINVQNGAYSSVTVSLTGIADPNQTVQFTVTPGKPQTCAIASPKYTYTPLIISKCTASAGLKNCNNPQSYVSFSAPNLSCAQTVSPPQPQV